MPLKIVWNNEFLIPQGSPPLLTPEDINLLVKVISLE